MNKSRMLELLRQGCCVESHHAASVFNFSGGGAPDNSGQNAAALMNAEIAKEMWGEYQGTYLPMERQFASEAFNYDTDGQRQKQAGLASADVTNAFAGQREQTGRQMASMGIDPSSSAWANQAGKLNLAEAASNAGAQNMARTNVDNMGYARKQDAIALGKGMPGTAASSMANSGAMYGNIANSNLQAQQNQQAAIGNTVGGAAAAYGMWRKDGGVVRKYGIKREQHLAGGGLAGNPRMQQVMVQPQVMPMQSAPTPNPVMQGIQAYRGVKNAENLGKGVAEMLAPAETGMAATPGAIPGIEAAEALSQPLTTEAINAGLEAAALESGGTLAGAEAAAATTAATEAAAAGTAAGGTGLGAALASNPVGWAIGAGLLLNEIFKKDGGSVARKDLSKGGKITGEGTETSDSIPAETKDGSYILNAETAKMLGNGLPKDKVPLHVSKNEIAVPPELVRVIGKEKLDKLNAAGLARRYGVKRRTA